MKLIFPALVLSLVLLVTPVRAQVSDGCFVEYNTPEQCTSTPIECFWGDGDINLAWQQNVWAYGESVAYLCWDIQSNYNLTNEWIGYADYLETSLDSCKTNLTKSDNANNSCTVLLSSCTQNLTLTASQISKLGVSLDAKTKDSAKLIGLLDNICKGCGTRCRQKCRRARSIVQKQLVQLSY